MAEEKEEGGAAKPQRMKGDGRGIAEKGRGTKERGTSGNTVARKRGRAGRAGARGRCGV